MNPFPPVPVLDKKLIPYIWDNRGVRSICIGDKKILSISSLCVDLGFPNDHWHFEWKALFLPKFGFYSEKFYLPTLNELTLAAGGS